MSAHTPEKSGNRLGNKRQEMVCPGAIFPAKFMGVALSVTPTHWQ